MTCGSVMVVTAANRDAEGAGCGYARIGCSCLRPWCRWDVGDAIAVLLMPDGEVKSCRCDGWDCGVVRFWSCNWLDRG